jgi:general secretion pathway protein F
LGPRGRGITVEELLALNDELRSLARAGVPLDRGLRALGGDLPGKLGRMAETISQRLSRGESLAGVLGDSSLALPPVYCAVVAAGVRGGRLSAALESLSKSVQRTMDLRRTMIAGLVYPLLVLLIATGVFLFTWRELFPLMRSVLPGMIDKQMPTWFQWLTWTVDQGGVGLLGMWLFVAFLLVVWFVRSRSAAWFGVSWSGWTALSVVDSAGRTATFAEMLALLIEQQVPMIEALELAGATSGDRRIQRAAEGIAERVRSGQRGGPVPRGLPPLLTWLVLTNAPTLQLVKILRQSAEGYRERAQRIAVFVGIYLPILLSAAVGTMVAVYYSILVLTPFFYLLNELAQP